jgi:hypothetical protein
MGREDQVFQSRVGMPQQRRLAHLPCAGDKHDLEMRGKPVEGGFGVSGSVFHGLPDKNHVGCLNYLPLYHY